MTITVRITHEGPADHDIGINVSQGDYEPPTVRIGVNQSHTVTMYRGVEVKLVELAPLPAGKAG